MPDAAFNHDARRYLQTLLDRLGLSGWTPLLLRDAVCAEYGFWHQGAAGPPPLLPGRGGSTAAGIVHMESPRVSRVVPLAVHAPLPSQFRQHALELAGMAIGGACLARLPADDDTEAVRPASTARFPKLKILILGRVTRPADATDDLRHLQAELLVTAFEPSAGVDGVPKRRGPVTSHRLALPMSGDLGALAIAMRAEAVVAFERRY